MSSVIEEENISTIIEEKRLAPQDAAMPKKKSSPKTFEGRIVSMTGDKLVMSSKEGTEYSHTLAKDRAVSLTEPLSRLLHRIFRQVQLRSDRGIPGRRFTALSNAACATQ